ncbi:MAG: GIY-YIG nuclease family protein [Patescibacteria group bacterium]|nr:GIY-YIG nuclease family protein [Patescibacteria group bacterium]
MQSTIPSFYYVYVLISQKDNKFYIGFTKDLTRRIAQHHNGESKATASRRPLVLIFYESYKNKYDALRREKYFKTSKGRATLKTMLQEYLNE